MVEVINSKNDSCKGCNRCVRECPMETANITYQDVSGNIKVKIDYEKCISCGRCVTACKHNARYYYDDTQRFFDDLSKGIPISLMAAPSIRTNIPEYKRLFTYLKQLGVNKIYDVSLGADICIWAHIKYIEKNGASPIITQPCPAIVTYCEMYHHELLKRLSPVHSPMACTSVYMKKYQGINDSIAALSPCIAKKNEFEDTHLTQYNITFAKLLDYLKENNIALPDKETEFDHVESGLGSLFPMPGGLKENIEYLMGKKFHIVKAEGFSVYNKIDKYAQTQDDFLPEIFDVLNCIEGCNIGSACPHDRSVFKIDKTMNASRKKMTEERKKEYYESVYKTYNDTFDLSYFLREYQSIPIPFPQITEEDINRAFGLLGKTDYEKQNVDCGACGSETCHNMARKIALGVNIPINCIVKSKEDAKTEHENNLLAHEQLMVMEKMHEVDEYIRVILNTSPQIIILFDSSYKVIDCNSAACDYLGFKTKEDLLVGVVERIAKSIPEYQQDGRPSISMPNRLVTAAKEGHTIFDTELHIGDSVRFLDVEMKKIPYKNSFAIIVYVFDMTSLREREKELIRIRKQNEFQLARLNLVLKATGIVMWAMEVVTDDSGNHNNIITWSDDLRNLLGFTDENDFPNLISSLNERLHPEDFKTAIDAFSRHITDKTGKTPYDIEYRLKKKNGEYAYYRASGETIRDKDGNPLRFAGALMDITEDKNLIKELEKQRMDAEFANKAKSSFLSTMSHEIRTPMNAILGITEIQLQKEKLDLETKEAIGKIHNSGDLLLGIINDILDLSKIEAGKMELITSKYEITSLISDTAQLNMMRIGSKPIEFELNVDENTPVTLFGDELRVKQILNNLLSNAFKYTTSGTVTLTVSTKKIENKDNEVTMIFSVRDTGQGMTKEQVGKMFTEYSRFNMEANRATEGTGLGMSITRNLIRMMNGEISIESEPEKGSVFTVYLPQGKIGCEVLGKEMAENLHLFRTSSRAQMKRVQISRDPMPYGKVLIVDDVETNIYVAKGLMSPYELKMESADSGAVAIEKIRSGKVYDIVFMDHMMPKMDGIEATKIIRSLGYKHPIVALTANAVSGQADIFLGSGFDDYISKPIDIRQLNVVLNKLIRDKQPPEVIEAARKNEKTNTNNRQSDSAQQALNMRFAEIFVRDASKVLAALEPVIEKNDYSNEDNIKTYIINVHGIKSALANMGQKDLSAAALKLETAAREKKFDILTSETPAFISSLRKYTDELAQQKKAAAGGDVADDKSRLTKKLKEIKDACGEYDENTVEKALAELSKTEWSPETKKTLDAIAEQLLHSDFDEIVNTIDKFMKI